MAVKKKSAKKKVIKKRPANKALSEKQILFCFRYLIHQNGALAAREVGYAENSCHVTQNRLLKNPLVKAIIKQGMDDKIERSKIDADWVLKEQVKVYERCMTVDPVFDKDGNETGEFRFDSSGANKALDSVGKHIKVNAFKATDDNDVPIDQHWVVDVVHSTKETYDKSIKNAKTNATEKT